VTSFLVSFQTYLARRGDHIVVSTHSYKSLLSFNIYFLSLKRPNNIQHTSAKRITT